MNSNAPRITARSMSLAFDNEKNTLRILAWPHVLPPVQLSNKLANTSLDVSLPAPSLASTCAALPLEDVRTFHVAEYRALDTGEWVRLFARMAKLESLWVCGSTAHRLPRTLTRLGWHEELGDGSSGTRAQILFPNLRTLTLEAVDFTDRSNPDTPLTLMLQHLLMERKDLGTPLKLRLCSCRNVLAEEIQDFDVLELDAEYFGELKIDVDLTELDSSDSEEDYEDYYDDANDTVEWPLGRKP